MSTQPDFIARQSFNERFIADHYNRDWDSRALLPRGRRRSQQSQPSLPLDRLPPLSGNTGRSQRSGVSFCGLQRRREEGDVEFHRGSSDMRRLLGSRAVDGVLDPSRNSQLTVHIELQLYDDLDARLERLAFLSRLGNYKAARAFFADNLHDQLGRLYVRVQYAELLLAQGDYKHLEEQKYAVRRRYDQEEKDSIDGENFLLIYWDMMQYYADSHKPRAQFGSPPKAVAVMIGNIRETQTLRVDDISSTQIRFLALAVQISTSQRIEPHRKILIDELSMFFRTQSKIVYEVLLRQGRVWDMHDFMSSLIEYGGIDLALRLCIGAADLAQGMRAVISDWTEHSTDVDISTILSLLGLFTSAIDTDMRRLTPDRASVILNLTIPLINSIRETDPQSMKSRPVVRWILEKARIGDENGPNEIEAYFQRLQQFPGITVSSRGTHLPQYAPLHGENPGWNVVEASQRLKDPVQIACRTAQELDDYRMSVLALQQLIRFSASPGRDLKALLHLQKETCEDYRGYVASLVSSYLIFDTHAYREELCENLAVHIHDLKNMEYLPPSLSFVASMMFRALSPRMSGPDVVSLNIQRAHSIIAKKDGRLAAQIKRKISDWERFAHTTLQLMGTTRPPIPASAQRTRSVSQRRGESEVQLTRRRSGNRRPSESSMRPQSTSSLDAHDFQRGRRYYVDSVETLRESDDNYYEDTTMYQPQQSSDPESSDESRSIGNEEQSEDCSRPLRLEIPTSPSFVRRRASHTLTGPSADVYRSAIDIPARRANSIS